MLLDVRTSPCSASSTTLLSSNTTGNATTDGLDSKACCGFLCLGTCAPSTYKACIKCNLKPYCQATIDYGSFYKTYSKVRRGRRVCIYPKTGDGGKIEMCNQYGVSCSYWDFEKAGYGTFSG